MLESTPRSEVPYVASSTKPPIALPASAALPASEPRRDERINDLETALRRLDEEKRKYVPSFSSSQLCLCFIKRFFLDSPGSTKNTRPVFCKVYFYPTPSLVET